jgi:hypothetical protein
MIFGTSRQNTRRVFCALVTVAGAISIASIISAASVLIGSADASGTIPAGEYAGQAFTVHLSAEYSALGVGTLITGSGTTVQVGSERFEGIVSPAFGTFQSLCCGEGHASLSAFTMTGQVRHVTAAVPHNHLFGAAGKADGTICFNISDQSGTIVDSIPHHDPGIGLLCDIPATVSLTGIAQTVVVDVKPGNQTNVINPNASGVIPVALISTTTFDATTIDPATVRFGPDGAAEIHGRGHIDDANGDGRPDLILHFAAEAAGITSGMTTVALVGKTFDRDAIEGSDAIVTVPE